MQLYILHNKGSFWALLSSCTSLPNKTTTPGGASLSYDSCVFCHVTVSALRFPFFAVSQAPNWKCLLSLLVGSSHSAQLFSWLLNYIPASAWCSLSADLASYNSYMSACGRSSAGLSVHRVSISPHAALGAASSATREAWSRSVVNPLLPVIRSDWKGWIISVVDLLAWVSLLPESGCQNERWVWLFCFLFVTDTRGNPVSRPEIKRSISADLLNAAATSPVLTFSKWSFRSFSGRRVNRWSARAL